METPAGVSPTFWKLVCDEPLRDAAVLDVGTGHGRIALALAPACGQVVGIDNDASAIEEARARAARAGIPNAHFVVADADDDGEFPTLAPAPRLVTAHLFMSEPLVRQSAAALPPDGALVVLGFHVDQWKETGRASRFAYDEDRMRRLLERHGFEVEHLSVERDVETFGSVEEALAAAIGLQEKWKSDGRWFRYVKFLEEGGRTLTRSHLIAKGRLGSARG